MEAIVAIIGAFLGLFIYSKFKDKQVLKENQKVIVEVEKKDKEAEELAKKIISELESANKKVQEIEEKKNEKLSGQDLADFFNNRNEPKH